MTALRPDPRWAEAAQALVDGCVDLPHDEDRVALLGGICQALGDELYPAFLRLLWLTSRCGDHAACAAVADTLVHALRTGRLPSGRRSAWGSAGASSAGFGGGRSLGPIEYLCAWHAQPGSGDTLPAAQFQSAARAVMELVDTSATARALYCEKLLADADDPLVGALTRQTRQAMRAMVTAWAGGVAPLDATTRFVDAAAGGGEGSSAPAWTRGLATPFGLVR